MWPFNRKAEVREAEGGYTQIIGRLIEAQAAGTTQQASATSAMEAASGLLSRALAGCTVDAPDDIAEAVSPRCLALIGRDLVRVGRKPACHPHDARRAAPGAVLDLVFRG